MRLSEVISGLAGPADRTDRSDPTDPSDLTGPASPEISGVSHDSRTVEPGDLYVALVGQKFDGRAFAGQAAERGAAAILGPLPAGESDRGAPASLAIPWVAAAEPRDLLGPLAARVYGHPDRELILAAVTGTNGKSTVATLIAAILDAAGIPAGFVGTLGYRFGNRSFPGGHTTPEASDLFRTLRRMRDAGARGVAMEVSSHALAMGRVAGAQFDVGVFTNLTRDHLDYHPDMEDYFAAKRRLFDLLKPGARAVVNLDDLYGRRLATERPDALTFGTSGTGADVAVVESSLDATGTHGVLRTPRGLLTFSSPLLGLYNLANLLAAAAAAEALGLPHDAVVQAFAAQRPIAGRME
ncbi:MAG: UDP-N-acetylmuramoyl-L-alanyl-D-glutamate--2,6-diaminopimelate ligase, partial [Acidobacteriota bacterium]